MYVYVCMSEISAQEAVYKRVMDEENELDEEQWPLLPTTPQNPIAAFFNSKEEAGLTSTPEAPILTSSSKQTSEANDVLLTSSPPTPIVEQHFQTAFPTSQSTSPQALPVPSDQESQRIVHPFSPVYTKTSFSIGGQNPPIVQTARAPLSYNKELLRECSSLHSVTCNTPRFSDLRTDALAKINQMQQPLHATPDVFEGKTQKVHTREHAKSSRSALVILQ